MPYRRVLLILLCLVLLAGCSKTNSADVRKKTVFTWFDTISTISCYGSDSEFERRVDCVEAVLDKWNRYLDIYHEYSGVNNLCTVNLNAGKNAVKVERELIDFLLFAKEQYSLTNGKVNVMMGSVLKLWHEARLADKPFIPEESALREAGNHISITNLEIDEVNCTVRIADAEASVDAGAIGKGWAAEKAAEWLKADGASGYVIDLGGNIRLVGAKPDGGGWKVGIKDPAEPENMALILNLKNCSCVTSGSYERFFVVGDRKYSHIIDPATLRSVDRFDSVSVICENSALADSLSTALSLLTAEEGKAIAEKAGAGCVWIYPDGHMEYTSLIEKLKK